jgi:hypothetical protein
MYRAVAMIIKPFLTLVPGLLIALSLGGCASSPVSGTRVIERPVPVPCAVEIPGECKSAYAVDRVSPRDDALTINRALRAEIEERTACEIKLLAAVNGCAKKVSAENATE